MKAIIYSGLFIIVAMVAHAATLTCQQTSDSSVSVPQFSSKEISVRCTASGGTVSNVQITPNSDPSTGVTITSSNSITSSISDSSSSTAKWTVTGNSPNTYTLSYTISSSGTNTWTGSSTTSVVVPSAAQLTVEYVLPPSFFTVTVDELDVKINNIGGTSASNVKLQLNDGTKYSYPVSIPAGSSASYSWTFDMGFNSSGLYTTKVYIGDVMHDSVAATVASSGSGNITQQTGWNLISLNQVPGDLAPASVFSGIVDDVDIVWGRDSGMWYKYDPDGSTTLSAMDVNKGYWVKMFNPTPLSVDGTPHSSTTIEMVSGWNLMGFPSPNDNINVNETVQPIISDLDIIWGYNGTSWFKFNPLNYDPADPGHLHNFTLGWGYWYKVTSDVNLTFS